MGGEGDERTWNIGVELVLWDCEILKTTVSKCLVVSLGQTPLTGEVDESKVGVTVVMYGDMLARKFCRRLNGANVFVVVWCEKNMRGRTSVEWGWWGNDSYERPHYIWRYASGYQYALVTFLSSTVRSW